MNFNHQTTWTRKCFPLVLTAFFSRLATALFIGSGLLFFREGGNPAFLLMPVILILLPRIFNVYISGFLADHISKRHVLLLALFLQFLLVFIVAFLEPTATTILVSLFLFGITSSIFSPAFYGIVPDSFRENELSNSSGFIGAGAFAGSALGIAILAAKVLSTTPGELGFSTAVVPSILALVFAGFIVPGLSPIQLNHKFSYSLSATVIEGLKELSRRNSILLTALGDVFFVAISAVVQPGLVRFATENLNLTSNYDSSILLFTPVIGIIPGSLIAGRLSGRKVELGLVPLGALGMALAMPIVVWFPGAPHKISFTMPEILAGANFIITIHYGALLGAFLAGFFSGIFIIPLRAFLQQRLTPVRRGAALAVQNTLVAIATIISWILVIKVFAWANPKYLIVSFGFAVFLVTIITMWLLPNFMLRFIILTLGNTVCKVRISGMENIPERGAALLMCNHVSFIDTILISAGTSRHIRFLLDESYYSLPLVGFVARLTGFFRVPKRGHIKAMDNMFQRVREHLDSGGIVCVFPEGRISRNGIMSKFRHGYKRMLPKDSNIPIIPVNISFIWGENFSTKGDNMKFKKPAKFPFFAAVTFGKAVSSDMDSFEIRQRICELSAEAGNPILPDERTIHLKVAQLAKRHPFASLLYDYKQDGHSAYKIFIRALLMSRHIRKYADFDSKYVGVLLPNGVQACIAILAILLADKIPAPLNSSVTPAVFDASVEKADIKLIITDFNFLSKTRIAKSSIMTEFNALEKLNSSFLKFIYTVGLFCIPIKEFMSFVAPTSAFDHNGTAALLFSSGSTGNPKGVMLSHHGIYIDARSTAQGVNLSKDDCIIGNLPLFHSFGLNVCLWMPLMYGVKVVFLANPLDGAGVRNAIKTHQATILFATPSFLQKYMQHAESSDFNSLRLVVTGAEKLRRDIADKLHNITDKRLKIVEAYGCTELSPVVTINIAQCAEDTGKSVGKDSSIGVPLENCSIRILDPLSFEPVAPGNEGLLFAKGPMVMQGYLGDEELTNKVIRDGYYNTGDVAKMDEFGYITICGRLSRFSKIAGEMVPHEMVEQIINEICGGDIRSVAVGGMPDTLKGEVLLVLYTDAMPKTPEEIVEELRERSISNLWIPKVKNFHKVDELPLLGSGKLDLTLIHKIALDLAQSKGIES